jgi:exodeoxyribonuclease-1
MPNPGQRQEPSLYWHDYETFGADPRRDRPAQFAGIRTDLDLNVIDEPLYLYCCPADDYLPHPEACLVTAITPQQSLEKGLPEAEFIARIQIELARPNTCTVGYNNIHFDDEVTRFTLYRNFFDPYAREWQNGNSRWDLIDVMRLTHALRPEGIQWPTYEDGRPSFRLDRLTVANDIAHSAAHDALADVHGTIAIARLLRERQPRLYDYVYRHRTKQQIGRLLNVYRPTPVLHVSSRYPAELGCIALVAPLAMHPTNKNEIIVYDLRIDPQPFLTLDAAALRERLFTRSADLAEGCERLPVKTVHINKSSVVVPAGTLTPEAADQWRIDTRVSGGYLERILACPQFAQNLQAAFAESREFEPITDPDFMLYSGGFFSNDDRARMEIVRNTSPEALAGLEPPFTDPRLSEMLFRYRARNYPQTLDAGERARWEAFRRRRLMDPDAAPGLTLESYHRLIDDLRQQDTLSEAHRTILASLDDYGRSLLSAE